MKKPVTIDMDGPRVAEVIRAVETLKEYGYVEGRISSGGKGFHLRIRGTVEALESWRLRVRCGDDIRRLYFDSEYNKKPGQILFSRKGTGKAGVWRSDIQTLFSDYVERQGE